jgi:uncharacterized membrane protein YcaP (DUF421 family)
VSELFAIHMSVVELVVRGSAIFWFLFLIFRFIMRRDIGGLGIADVLLLVIIADAAQNAMSGEYKTITEGCILIATIIFWNWLLDWASYRYDWAQRLAAPPRLLLVNDGKPQLRNMARQLIRLEDLESKLRLQGVEDMAQIKKAYLEPDGDVSVIRKSGGSDSSAAARRSSRTPGAG